MVAHSSEGLMSGVWADILDLNFKIAKNSPFGHF